MSKKNRGILNQIVEEPIEETTQEVEVPEEKLITEEEVVAQEEFIEELPEEVIFSAPVPDEMGEINELPIEKCVCIEPCIEPCACEAPKPERSLDSLSRNEYRAYLRTGSIPQ